MCFFVKKTFLSFPKNLCQFVLIFHPRRKCFSGHHTLMPRPYLSFPFPSLLKLYILNLQDYCLTFILWTTFFSSKEQGMVCLNSRMLYVFKNGMHNSKTLESSNFSQKVQILSKKLREIRKSSSYTEKFIQGSNKFV